ncbi:unnamed protein product, partial [Meganyctiphanes norvegica]
MVNVSDWNDSCWISSYLPEAGALKQVGILTYVLLACCLAATLPVLVRGWRWVSAIERLPGPRAWPLIGNALIFNVNPRALFRVMVDICCYEEGLTRVWVGCDPNVFIYKANFIKIILSNSKHIEKAWFYRYWQPWIGLGLFTSKGGKWKSRKKLLTPAFHCQLLDEFVEVFNRQSLKLVDKLKEANEKPIDIFPFISRCALDTICETIMGVNLNTQDESESEYLQSVSKNVNLIGNNIDKPLKWQKPEYTYIRNIISKYAEIFKNCMFLRQNHKMYKRRAYFKYLRGRVHIKHTESQSSKPIDGKLLLYGFIKYLSLEYYYIYIYIRSGVECLSLEGQGSNPVNKNYIIYHLDLNPDVQEKLHTELEGIFGDSNREITSEDLSQLKYLECCIKESLRLFPSVPIHSRNLNEDLQLDRFVIPAGTTVHVMQYVLHRDPTYFPDPEAFMPERFGPEQSIARHPYAYIPFSAGPRNCIGQKYAIMEEKIILSNILRHFHIESQVPREDFHVLNKGVLTPENGNILKLSPRNITKCLEN